MRTPKGHNSRSVLNVFRRLTANLDRAILVRGAHDWSHDGLNTAGLLTYFAGQHHLVLPIDQASTGLSSHLPGVVPPSTRKSHTLDFDTRANNLGRVIARLDAQQPLEVGVAPADRRGTFQPTVMIVQSCQTLVHERSSSFYENAYSHPQTKWYIHECTPRCANSHIQFVYPHAQFTYPNSPTNTQFRHVN